MMAALWHNSLNPVNPVPLPFVLDNLTVTTTTAPQQNLIEDGDQYYRDEPFTLSNIPAVLNGGRWIMPANADRLDTSTNYLSFGADRAVNVYIAYDAAATQLPDWMSGFTDTGNSVSTTDPAVPILRLYVQNFPSGGNITLGGNLQGAAAGAQSNYIAIVRAM